jgi:hypothetical protein
MKRRESVLPRDDPARRVDARFEIGAACRMKAVVLEVIAP